MRNEIILVLAGLLCTFGVAQTPASKAKKTKLASGLPVFEIGLSEDTDYQPLPWSGQLGRFGETYCTGDSNLYVVNGGSGLVALTPKGIVSFLSDKMPDIPHPSTTFLGMNPSLSASGVSFLVTGKDDAKVKTKNWTDEEGHNHVDRDATNAILHYIARFDTDGTYRGAIKLDLPFLICKFATFSSGILITQGMEQSKIPRIALLSSSGEFLQYLDLPKDVSTSASGSTEEIKCNGCTADMNSVVFNSYFTPWRNEVLLKREFSGSVRIYEIQESGQVRVTKVSVPENYDVGQLVPTDRNWLLRFNKPDAHGVRPRAFDSLLEIDPQNGQPLREYRLKSPDKLPETIVSCFVDGEFWGIRQDKKKGQIQVVRGTAAPY